MLILAFESSAKAASVALLRDGVLLAETFLNNGKTHSATLMPMAEQMIKDCSLEISELDCVAVAIGPGSFTGIRIGVSAAKGFAWASDKPICPVSTLEGMATQMVASNGIICSVMDARRNQVYNALFLSDGAKLCRLTPDRAISIEELLIELSEYDEKIFLVGDGSKLCYSKLSEKFDNLIMPPSNMEMQRAAGIAIAAYRLASEGAFFNHKDVIPNYLRLSQAERERLARMKQVHAT